MRGARAAVVRRDGSRLANAPPGALARRPAAAGRYGAPRHHAASRHGLVEQLWVHPFWLMDNYWRYGDRVFIVEPPLLDCTCWDLRLLQTSGDRDVARHALLSIEPALVRAGDCAQACSLRVLRSLCRPTRLSALCSGTCVSTAAARAAASRLPCPVTLGHAGARRLG